MKRVKAWAVVDKRGSIWISTADIGDKVADILQTKRAAQAWADATSGERVVPVEIVYKDPGK